MNPSRPRDSSRTLPGVEPPTRPHVDHSVPRSDRTTPHGDGMLTIAEIRALGPESGVVYLAEQVGALREVLARLESIVGTAASHSDRAATVASNVMDDVSALVAKANTLEKYLDDVIEAVFVLQPLPERMRDVYRLLVDTQRELLEVKLLIGTPPQDLSGRQSLTRDLTKEEYEQLEQGTGLAGVAGRLVAGQKRLEERLKKHIETRLQVLERRVGIAAVLGSVAASSPSWAPQAIDLLSKVFGG